MQKFKTVKKKPEEMAEAAAEAAVTTPAKKYYTIGNRANKMENSSPVIQEAAQAAVPKAMSQTAMDRNVASQSLPMKTNYMAGIKDSLSKGNVPNALKFNADRNEKLNTYKMPYRQYTTEDILKFATLAPEYAYVREGQRLTPYWQDRWDALVAEKLAPDPEQINTRMLGGYDINTDFESLIQQAIAEGDYGKAQELERYRNEKIGILGLDNPVTDRFNYLDPYQGEVEAKRQAINNTEPFNYDYRTDEQYQSIKKLKEKEADKAYKDGYAQLSRQFDGDIPVNMLNKLQATKSEIIDQADSYIPTLENLAYQKYQDDYNRMLTDYNLSKQLADEDYARWLSDRDFLVGGIENVYNRGISDRDYNYTLDTRNKNYEHNIYLQDDSQAHDSDMLSKKNAHDLDILDKTQAWNTSERVASEAFQAAQAQINNAYNRQAERNAATLQMLPWLRDAGYELTTDDAISTAARYAQMLYGAKTAEDILGDIGMLTPEEIERIKNSL